MIERKTWLKWHRRVGAFFALLLAIQGLSGVLLVFRAELEPRLTPALFVPPSRKHVPLQTLYEAVTQAHPDARVARAEFSPDANFAAVFRLKESGGDRLVAVDPASGEIVRDAKAVRWPLEWVFTLHQTLFAGPIGETLVGIDGIALLFIALAGPIAWWPGRKRLRQGLTVRWAVRPDLRWRMLHRSAGALLAVVILTSAVTGIGMVWKDNLRSAAQTFLTLAAKPAPHIAERPGVAHLPIDELVARAQRIYDTPLRQLRFLEGGHVLAVYLEGDRTWRADGTNQVYLDAYDGRVIGRYVAGELPFASEFFDWLFTVHTGLWAGVATMVLMAAGGLTLLGLSVSGPWLWWSRERQRRRGKIRGAPVPKPAG